MTARIVPAVLLVSALTVLALTHVVSCWGGKR